MRFSILVFYCSAILCFASKAQVRYSDASLAEKVYLQLASHVYTNDETIWFKAIVGNAQDHSPTELSGVLYAELIDPDEHIIERKLIRLQKGIAAGFFQLNQTLLPVFI